MNYLKRFKFTEREQDKLLWLIQKGLDYETLREEILKDLKMMIEDLPQKIISRKNGIKKRLKK